MKFVVVINLVLLAVALGAPTVEEVQERINGENGWLVPQFDGSFKWMTMEEAEIAEREDAKSNSGRSSTNVQFYLYTPKNPESPQKIEPTLASIQKSNFNGRLPTKFIIHGWRGTLKDDINVKVREAWLAKESCNVISVDWSSRAGSLLYPSSKNFVPTVGEKVAELVDFLNANFELSFDTLTIIGHSLGAHAAGYAGKNVRNGRIGTIIGLDPALPLFSYSQPKKRLSSGDANYVESIQTNGGKLGFLEPIGEAAFYPNGGKSQPGCGIDLTGACSHGRSYYYYAEAVHMNTYPSIRCPSYNAAVGKECGATFSSVHMGDVVNSYFAKGTYYVPVNSKAPYGFGSQ